MSKAYVISYCEPRFPGLLQPRQVCKSLERAQWLVHQYILDVVEWTQTMGAHTTTYWTPILPDGDQYVITAVPCEGEITD